MVRKLTRYVIYTRVSERGSTWHERDIESSCDTQEVMCRAHVQRIDPSGKIVRVVKDEFQGARKGIPPNMRALMTELRTNTAPWDVLVVTKLDRFSRSQLNGNRLYAQLDESGKGLISIQEGLDFASIHGRMIMGILLSTGQAQAEQIAKDTRDRMLQAAANGFYVTGRAPYGFTKSKDAHNVLAPDPETAPIVRSIFAAYCRGETITQIRRQYPMSANTIAKMLRNQVYMGKVTYAGKTFEGAHAPLIADDIWNAVQDRLPKATHAPRPTRQKYDYLLTGLIRCECGKAMSPCTQRKNGATIPYYRCADTVTCPNRTYVRADTLEKSIMRHTAKAHAMPGIMDSVAQQIRNRSAGTKDSLTERLSDMERELSQYRKQHANILRAFTNGLISKGNAGALNEELSVASKQIAELEQEQSTLKEKVRTQRRQEYNATRVAETFNSIAIDLERCKDRNAIRRFLRATIEQIQRQNGAFTIRYRLVSIGNHDWHPLVVSVELAA